MRFLFGVLIGAALTCALSELLYVVPPPGGGPARDGAESGLTVKPPANEPAAIVAPRVVEAPPPEPVKRVSDGAFDAAPAHPALLQHDAAADESAPPRDDAPSLPLATPDTWASAWVPFQTERSARGFADMLAKELQHPFEVRREATHRYRVTFGYADEAERERVLAAVRALTGAES